jgi:RND family efflux transporter MFP subunit
MILGLAGCTPAAPEDIQMPPPEVTVDSPVEKYVTDYSNFTGRTCAVVTIKVRARVTGYLDKVFFTDGEIVKKGTVLCRIDPRIYQARYKAAAARVVQAQASLKLARANNARYKALAKKEAGAVSQQQLNQYQAEEDQAEANLHSAEADQDLAKVNLDFTKVLAPVSGRVSRKMTDPGNLVKADDTVLTTIVTLAPMYAYFDVDDLTFLRINELIGGTNGNASGAKLPGVLMGLPNEKDFPHEGTIDFVDNQVEAGTGTVKMRGIFDNKDGRIAPGLFVRIRVPLGTPHRALLLTDRAIDNDQSQKVVYVVGKGNVAEKRVVQLGGLHDGLREIVSGVRAGEQVVVDGLQYVRGGMVVVPKTAGAKEQVQPTH